MKKLLAILLALALALCCAACQSTGQGETSTQEPSDGSEQMQEEDVQEQPTSEEDVTEAPVTEGEQEEPEETPEEEEPADGQEAAQTAEEGLLTEEEITTLEGLYGKAIDEVLEALSLNGEEAFMQDEISITFESARTIGGLTFLEALNFSADEGFYGVDYRTGVPSDTEQLAETLQQIYDDAVVLYGEPNTYPGLENILSEQLAQGQMTGMETWAVSDGTTLTMKADDMGDLVVFSLSYQITVSYN